jgi:hypothetical protein
MKRHSFLGAPSAAPVAPKAPPGATTAPKAHSVLPGAPGRAVDCVQDIRRTLVPSG